MKKRINKTHLILLIFSTVLFSTVVYFMSNSLVLGASVGGNETMPVPVPASTEQQAELPVESSAEAEQTVESQKSETPKEVYVVKNGETLWEIAQDMSLSIPTLMNRNQLSSSVIFEGQELVLDN
ncbi:LysM peptidoglycan-binding domain-containing protein [Enterococcus sp. 5H]|uniref:LysM peptidoglycan-binding domain-containing protein n=1 Tax=Enterococcus sp. 5H TaxID=1229490 RepID=UPI002302FDE9|nr:LysM peptidoglycan-binding domain-containing protein [Enterococcus sp. 5H]MDA9471745.1 hypothetical protein [Enterococcus sp. 5H]